MLAYMVNTCTLVYTQVSYTCVYKCVQSYKHPRHLTAVPFFCTPPLGKTERYIQDPAPAWLVARASQGLREGELALYAPPCLTLCSTNRSKSSCFPAAHNSISPVPTALRSLPTFQGKADKSLRSFSQSRGERERHPIAQVGTTWLHSRLTIKNTGF